MQQINGDGHWIESLEKRLVVAEDKIAKLASWMNWLTGAGFVGGVLLSLSAKNVIKVLFGP